MNLGPLCGLLSAPLNPTLFTPQGGAEVVSVALPAHFSPNDEHNLLLQSHVHPRGYSNPQSQDYDVVVIGAGVSGLISVIMGAWLGKKCALIEKHAMGGDCLNTGII